MDGVDQVDQADPKAEPAPPLPLIIWRIEVFTASNGARFVKRSPLGSAPPPPDFEPFTGQGELTVGPLQQALSFPLAGARDERTAAELYPAALKAARQAALAELKARAAEQRQQLVVPFAGGIPPGLPGYKNFPPAKRNGRGPRLAP
jgi:hypothetical protein